MPSPAPQGTTVCGIVGVVFGALGLVLSFIPIINNIAAIFGLVGAVLAIVAHRGHVPRQKAWQSPVHSRGGTVGAGHRHHLGHAIGRQQGA